MSPFRLPQTLKARPGEVGASERTAPSPRPRAEEDAGGAMASIPRDAPANPPAPHPACLRWAVNISRWHPSDDHYGPEFRFLLALLPEHEREECLRFRFMYDKKRALLSRLMQRAACARVADVPHADVLLRRTKGKKPFFAWTEMPLFDADSAADLAAAPNFNFNVSHEGEFVVLASEPVAIVGVDVAAPGQLRNRNRKGGAPSVEETLESFRETLSVSERNAIRAFQTEAEKEDAFRRHWSCKEALVKAMGVGLGMELGRASFSFKKQHEHAYDAVVEVDGEPKTKWRFRTERVFGSSDAFGCFGDATSGSNQREDQNENAHWITTARGPTEDVTDAFGAFINTWRAPDAGREDDATWRAVVDAPAPPYSLIEVGDLVPRECIDAFRRAGGEAR